MERIFLNDRQWCNELIKKQINKDCIHNHAINNMIAFIGSKNYVRVSDTPNVHVFLNENGELAFDKGHSKLLDAIAKSDYFELMKHILTSL